MALTVAVSAAVHAVLFAVVLDQLARDRGGGGQLLDAIEIEVVDAVARESVAPRDETGGGVATEAAAGGLPQQAHQVATAHAEPSRSAADVATSDAAADADLTAAPKVQPDGKQEPNTPLPPTERSDTATASTSAVAAAEAGTASTTVAPAAQPGSAASGASPGTVARFNAEVRKALGRNRPRGWPAGHLLLAFSVSEAGRVENAELTKESANGRLNRLALEWIATVDMPVPPQGLPPAERRYSIPITVR